MRPITLHAMHRSGLQISIVVQLRPFRIWGHIPEPVYIREPQEISANTLSHSVLLLCQKPARIHRNFPDIHLCVTSSPRAWYRENQGKNYYWVCLSLCWVTRASTHYVTLGNCHGSCRTIVMTKKLLPRFFELRLGALGHPPNFPMFEWHTLSLLQGMEKLDFHSGTSEIDIPKTFPFRYPPWSRRLLGKGKQVAKSIGGPITTVRINTLKSTLK